MSEDAALDPAALRATLDELVVRGAEVWDAPAVALVRTLLTKAESLPGVARAHLLKRAATRLQILSGEFDKARARAGRTYAQLARQGLDPAKRLDGALQYGRFEEVERAKKRHDEARVAARRAIVQPWLERLSQEAQARGLSQPPPALSEDTASPGVAPERDTVTGLAAAIYQDAAADASARLAVAQARTELPENAGRYHAPSVAARALEALDALAPAYLRVQVARLEAIGNLQRWVVPPPPDKPGRAKAAKPKKKPAPKARKSRATKKATKPDEPARDDPRRPPTEADESLASLEAHDTVEAAE